MTRAIWIDATSGAAGDMLLGALLDAGAAADRVTAALASLVAAGTEPISLELQPVRRHGLRATRASIAGGQSQARRSLSDILALIGAATLDEPVRRLSADVFGVLARAEAGVHGITVEDVHFHEVGALDAIADIVGCAAALHELGLLEPDVMRVVSSVGVGSGVVRSAHGLLPVPVPAVVRLLADAGAPAAAGPGPGELCTPTGAALLTSIATHWGDLPPMAVSAAGSGAGTRDTPDHANLVRVILGDKIKSEQPWRETAMVMIESTIDDLDPRLWPDALEALHRAGASDAWLTPVLMRKGRPGHVVSALAAVSTVDAVLHAMTTSTTTLGVRIQQVARRALPRDVVTVKVGGYPVSVKRGLADGIPVTVQPEYADASAAAYATGLAISTVIDVARELARGVGTENEGPAA